MHDRLLSDVCLELIDLQLGSNCRRRQVEIVTEPSSYFGRYCDVQIQLLALNGGLEHTYFSVNIRNDFVEF